jgi:hypothetical protein
VAIETSKFDDVGGHAYPLLLLGPGVRQRAGERREGETGAVPSRRAATIRGDTKASGASSRTWRSTLPSRRAIAAKLAARPCARSSIQLRALAIAIRRASRRDGFMGVL